MTKKKTIFGFNTDVPGANATYHVQTEDRGAKNPVIDSIIYVGGKIVNRVRTPYVLEEKTHEEIEALVRNQHRNLVEAIRSGSFAPSGASNSAAPGEPAPSGYSVQLLNQDSIERDGQLYFELAVWDRAKRGPLEGATLDVRWIAEGLEPQKMTLETEEYGTATISFPKPLEALDVTLLACAKGPEGQEVAKFHVRGSYRKVSV